MLPLLYTPALHITICRDINPLNAKLNPTCHLLALLEAHHILHVSRIDYLVKSDRKNQLLLTYNITSIITFPTRVQKTSATAIDNMFLDTTWLEEHTIIPITNGLLDHDAQLLTIETKVSYRPGSKLQTFRKFNDYAIYNFINKLSNESWDKTFTSEDKNDMFNSFLNTYTMIFNLCEHPTSLLAAPSNTYIGQTAALFRAPLNTNTSNGAALLRAPTKQLRNASGSPFQGPNRTAT